uniref:hypothetical protein n=1 Tax=uncultured Shewanella sp. TaxID=173975 RepID=UPI0026211FFD
MKKIHRGRRSNLTQSKNQRVTQIEYENSQQSSHTACNRSIENTLCYRNAFASRFATFKTLSAALSSGIALTGMLAGHAQAADLYAPDNWVISEDTHIAAGDRMFVNRDATVTLGEGITFAIDKGAELIIADGVNFNIDSNAKIEVYGSLLGEGIEGNEIRFTSSLANPTHSSWQGIYANSGANINLSYSQISHALTGIYANLTISDSQASDEETNINVDHSRFIDNSYGAIFYQLNDQFTLDATLQYNQFIGSQNHHLFAQGNSPMMATTIDARYNWWDSALAATIATKIFDSSQSPFGLHVDYSDYYFSARMESTDERSLAVTLPDELLVDGEYGLFNDYYVVANLNISSGQVLRLKAGHTLTIKAGVRLTIASGAQLIIEEGAKVELEDSASVTVSAGGTWQLNAGTQVLAAENVQLDIHGTLKAEGVEDNLVYFGSSLEAPEKDSWHGIKAYANSTVTLRHTQIS